jgi:hypothetical protein
MILTCTAPAGGQFDRSGDVYSKQRTTGGRNVMTGDGSRDVAWNLQTKRVRCAKSDEGSKTHQGNELRVHEMKAWFSNASGKLDDEEGGEFDEPK